MKKIISLFTTLCIVFGVLGTFTVFAEETGGTYKDTMTWTLDEDGTLTISGTGVVEYVVDTYEEHPLPWSDYHSSIKHIVLEEGITGIEGEWTFADLENLQSVTFPESITVIGYEAFIGCSYLTSVTIPKNVKEIGANAFGYCQSLVSINVSEENLNYSSIDGVLFNKDKTEIICYPCGKTGSSYTFPENITSIRFHAFGGNSYLTSIAIPDGVTKIDFYAFMDCGNLSEISIPDSVTEIGFNAFDGTAYYNDETKWDNNVLYIGNYLIKAKEEISGDYEIRNGTRAIGGYAFNGCKELTSITIPDSVVDLGEETFGDCDKITEIIIPNGVTKIGEYLFYNCDNLVSVTLPDNLKIIGDSAFEFCQKLTSVEVPDSVTQIGNGAFQYSGLTSITIPRGVTEIADYAFYYCDFTSVTIPSWVTNIGKSAFNGANLTEVIVDGNNPNYISEDGVLFNRDKTAIILYPSAKEGTSYAVPDGVKSIESNAFYSCQSLTEITLPNVVETISNGAFGYCKGLTEFTIPDSVMVIGGSAFKDCQNLASIVIGKNVKSIGYETFYDCYALTDITIPDSVTVIGESAFRYCKNLKSITIGRGVKTIGNYVFFQSNNITDIYYSNTQSDFEKISLGAGNDWASSTKMHYMSEHTHMPLCHEAKPATCTEDGTAVYWECTSCNKLFSDEECTEEIDAVPIISATGHTEVTDEAVEPTCETDGKTAGSHCSVCNAVITAQTIIPKLNHDWGEWSITTEPTFDVTGKAERTCKNDSAHKDSVDLPILSDTTVWTEDLKIEPTETEKGSVTYTSQYGNVTIIIPALNPEYNYSIKYENGKAVVTAKQDGTYTVIFAAYDNGILLSVGAQEVSLVKGENKPIEPQNFNANGTVKVMLWDSLMGMKPLCATDGN